jgi:hypothetical protein
LQEFADAIMSAAGAHKSVATGPAIEQNVTNDDLEWRLAKIDDLNIAVVPMSSWD